MRKGLGFAVFWALAMVAGAAQAQGVPETDCDRLAGFWLMPRAPGIAQAYHVTDPYGAILACDAAINAHPTEPFFKLILARALSLVPENPLRALPLVQQARDAYPAMVGMQLGYMHSYGLAGLSVDDDQARRSYEGACALAPALGAVAACTQAALMQVEGRGGDPDPDGGLRRLAGLCAGGWPLACTERMLIGEIYGFDTPEDQAGLLALGCEGGDLFACSLLGQRYQEGYGVAFDAGQARGLYETACDGGDAHGCANLAEVYRSGVGVAPDVPRAVALFTRACAGLDAFACTTLGVILDNAQGVPRDQGRAMVAFETACELGDPEACDMADALK